MTMSTWVGLVGLEVRAGLDGVLNDLMGKNSSGSGCVCVCVEYRFEFCGIGF